MFKVGGGQINSSYNPSFHCPPVNWNETVIAPSVSTFISVDELTTAQRYLYDIGVEINDENLQHLATFKEALRIYDDRSKTYGQAWRKYGALGNILFAAQCFNRLMKMWWHSDGTPGHKNSLDDAYDGINYLVFFIRNVKGGNMRGEL
jgi:hypothetical protein